MDSVLTKLANHRYDTDIIVSSQEGTPFLLIRSLRSEFAFSEHEQQSGAQNLQCGAWMVDGLGPGTEDQHSSQ